jgi:hypothetical protein
MGIDATSGHIGMSGATQFKNTASQVGGAAFEIARTGVSMGAGMLGGPAAANAASGVMSMARSGVSAATGGLGGATAQAQASGANMEGTISQVLSDGDDKQMTLLKLQQAINMQSSMFNTLTNCQKAKHDAAMAAIQNTR